MDLLALPQNPIHPKNQFGRGRTGQPFRDGRIFRCKIVVSRAFR
jgi:hypothetical protein